MTKIRSIENLQVAWGYNSTKEVILSSIWQLLSPFVYQSI